ncbi:ABC transporter permease subunit [Paenibacillus sp. HB172176]|uniref:ABC transporter permease n=1 Tax=Paenibacillus sp. HB172176 TaxID=2493690 RepID=UPI00143AAD19|nr:ABC transporter permease subunit [Paenibacillus sp. HB172176]
MRESILPRLRKDIVRNKAIYLMLLPVLVFYIIFEYGPMYGAIIAFKDFNVSRGILGSDWVGFSHFTDFFESIYFWRVMKNTFVVNLYLLIFAFPAPILLALLLNEVRANKFKRTVQSITYLPHFISVVVVVGMIVQFTERNGFITQLLSHFGGSTQASLLAFPENFRAIFVVSEIWQQIGWGSIIYLAALSGISNEQYEAATIDGAGRWRKVLNVTIPGIMPIIVIMFILNMGKFMTIGFEKIVLMYNPNTYETADVINTYVYRVGLSGSFEFSYATAVGLFQSAMNFALLILANWISRKVNETSLW